MSGATDSATASVTPSFAQFLPAWMAQQRWYAGKGRVPVLSRIGGLRLEDPAGEVGIDVLLLLDEAGPDPTIYQVPLTYRSVRLAGVDHALVATVEHSSRGRDETCYIYDAPHDPVFAAALVQIMLAERKTTAFAGENRPDARAGSGEQDWGEQDWGVAAGQRFTVADPGQVGSSRVLGGEQSNTSIILDMVQSDGSATNPLICKLFRVLHHGENPDVVVQSALAAAGSTRVPLSVGSLSGEWPDPSAPGGMARGHLAFAQEFLPGVQDAWRVALAAVASGVDFAERAHSLGQATAQVHATLAQAMSTRDATDDDVAALTRSMRARHAAAVTEVPALAEYDSMVYASIELMASAKWPAMQRIHGDYHLGQALEVAGRGWVLVDFEGEPLRPLAERNLPDLALRDVAGMLRSFDYVAGSWEQTHSGRSAAAWATRARTAFLEGYAKTAGRDPREDAALLDALELDKALYEVVYEARNRPTWLTIPTTAIARLTAGPRSDLRP